MNNVVKTKLCWSSKNKDLHACNALSFSAFILFLASSLLTVRMSLLNVTCVCLYMSVCINMMKVETHHSAQFSFPLH